MENFNWVVVLVLLFIGGIGVFIPGIPLGVISYLYFAISVAHNQWLSDRRLRPEGVD